MNFEFSEEQRAFRDSARRYLSESYDFETRQKIIRSEDPFSAQVWDTCAELGWFYLPFPEHQGGLGGSILDSVLLFEELGRQLVVEPFLETLVLTGGLLSRCESESSNQLLGELMSGKLQGAFAHTEAISLGSAPALSTRAEKKGSQYKLNGRKIVVHNVGAADVIIVSAKLDRDELALFLLRADDAGLSLQNYPTIDGRTAGDISFKNLEVDEDRLLFRGEMAETVLKQIQADAMLAMSADMVGSMNTLLERTVNYTKERRQFNSRLVDFQVLRHRMVDMFVATELATSLLYAAATKVRDGAPDAFQIAAAAKAKTDKSAKMVAHAAIQLHGGIATTNELPIGHHLKRITVHEQRFGNTRTQLSRFQSPPGAKTDATIPTMKVA